MTPGGHLAPGDGNGKRNEVIMLNGDIVLLSYSRNLTIM